MPVAESGWHRRARRFGVRKLKRAAGNRRGVTLFRELAHVGDRSAGTASTGQVAAQEPVRDAAEQEADDRALSSRPDHDHVGAHLARQVGDRVRGPAGAGAPSSSSIGSPALFSSSTWVRICCATSSSSARTG